LPFFFLPFFFFFFGNGLIIRASPGVGYFLYPGTYSTSSGIRIALCRTTILCGKPSLASLSLMDSISFTY